MLNTIKDLIKGKSDFLEAAAIIFEDGSGQNLDDVIVLGEEKDATPEMDVDPKENDHDDDDDKEGKEDKEPKDSDEEGEGDEGKNSPEGDDVGSMTIDDEPETSSPTEVPAEGDDILNDEIGDPDQPMPLPGSDLPEPMGAQTGEPINPLDDILNVEIDLGSNIVKDVLPVPPANAYEALADNGGTQHVDSGFGGESNDVTPPIEEFGEKTGIDKDDKEPKDDKKIPEDDGSEKPHKESENYLDSFFSTPMTEAITFGDEPAAPAGGEAAPAEPAPAEAPAATEEPPAEGAESEVTSAVLDKVAEADAGATTEDSKDAKEDLLKKLGSITKNLEDAKKAVMSAIQ